MYFLATYDCEVSHNSICNDRLAAHRLYPRLPPLSFPNCTRAPSALYFCLWNFKPPAMTVGPEAVVMLRTRINGLIWPYTWVTGLFFTPTSGVWKCFCSPSTSILLQIKKLSRKIGAKKAISCRSLQGRALQGRTQFSWQSNHTNLSYMFYLQTTTGGCEIMKCPHTFQKMLCKHGLL